MMQVAFYCVADERYFLGAVGMLNSLHLLGHGERMFVVDRGLTPAQRDILRPHLTLVPAPTGTPPHLLKTVGPLRHPAEVMVLIDADVVVTRPLTELIDQASQERVVAFRNDRERFVQRWGAILDLGPSRRQPYVSSGIVFLGGAVGAEVLRLMDDRQRRVNYDLTFWRRNRPEYPFLYGDQDVLNAILSTRVERERTMALDHRLAATPPYPGLRVVDEATLGCAYDDGVRPYVLHQLVRKPWLERMYHSPYSRLLARLLLGEDVAVPVPERWVPRRMRNGLVPRAARAVFGAQDLGRWYAGEVLPEWIGARVRALARRRTAGGQ